MAKLEVSNAEFRTIRDAMRELNRLVDSLESGDADKFVLMKHGQMRAVVVSVETFSHLTRASDVATPTALTQAA
jgi:hypothetical protein